MGTGTANSGTLTVGSTGPGSGTLTDNGSLTIDAGGTLTDTGTVTVSGP